MHRLAGVLGLLLAAPAWAADCAQFGLKAAAGVNGYVWRGDRCEGLYLQDVINAGELRIVSFSTPINPLEAKSIKLNWKLPASAAPVNLRAISLRSRHYYRMDVPFFKGGGFNWDASVLQSEKINASEIALVGWTQVPQFKEEVYFPIFSTFKGDYSLGMLTGTELTALYVSTTYLGKDARQSLALRREEKQANQYYPGGRMFRVELGKTAGPGFYRVRVAGLARYGGAITRSLIIYLP